MLEHLYIKNFTIIDELDIPFFSGFSVITGETGAGKSIILGAIGLLLGQRADTKLIRTGEKKCTIEAHFHIVENEMKSFFEENDIDYDETCILRRELTDNGKSRAFINDTPVSLTLIKSLGEHLIDIHSQHQNLLLQKDDFQMGVVDIVAKNKSLRDEYLTVYLRYKEAVRHLAEIKEDIAQNKRDEDFLRFQYQELYDARLVEGMQDELERERDMLTHAEDIRGALTQIAQILDGEERDILSGLHTASNLAENIQDVYPTIAPIAERMESARIELLDIAEEVTHNADNIDIDPSRLDVINSQLDTIYHLQQKHHISTVDELIELRDDLAMRIDSIDNSEQQLTEQTKLVETLRTTCLGCAIRISNTRKEAAKTIEKDLQQRLVPLGIPNVKFQVRITTADKGDKQAIEPTPTGIDIIEFLFSANKNVPLQPIAQVASGGEIARVMLAIKSMVGGIVKLPTIIFDEVDTGTSGKIAQQMAYIMKEMGAQERQVITITHLPQIAALGSHHYRVYKEDDSDSTTSRMQLLTDEQRVMEIAQMLSGNNITEAAINNAKELLQI